MFFNWLLFHRQLAQAIQATVRSYPNENNQLILKSVLDLVRDSRECFRADTTNNDEVIRQFGIKQAKVQFVIFGLITHLQFYFA